MEGSLSNMRSFNGPMANFMGTHEVAADLKAMGFDMVNRTNNHLFDSESDGMFATNALLDEAGIVHAGSGQNLGGRPGLNMLNYPEAIVLAPEQLASLRQVRDELLEQNACSPEPVGRRADASQHSRLGIPRFAPLEIGRRILERVQRLSRELGTTTDIDGNVGIIRVGPATSGRG